MHVSLTFLSWWCVFFWVISASRIAIMFLDFLNMCVCACPNVHATSRWWANFHPKSLSSPSNITHGLCFDPLASHSPQPPLKPRAYTVLHVCVRGGPQGCMHIAPLSLLCSKFTPSCPYSHRQFLPCSFVYVCSAGLITAEQGLALFPAHSAIRSLRGILLLLLLHSPRLFFKVWELVALALVPVNPRWESSAGFFSGSEKFELSDACLSALEIIQEYGCYHHNSVQRAIVSFNGFLVKVHRTNADLLL